MKNGCALLADKERSQIIDSRLTLFFASYAEGMEVISLRIAS